MSVHGPAQHELIRRYARTLRVMHADAMASRPTPHTDRAGRIIRDRSTPREPIRQAAKVITDRSQPAP
jgi:hypothetical protein